MATIKDVAKKAGVAVATVSRVLNNRGYISDVTRHKVYQAMEELNYFPNEVARSLLRRRSNVIGLIIPTVAHPFFGELTSYIEFFAYKKGFKVLISNSINDKKKELEYLDLLVSNRVDGIIMGSHTVEVDQYTDHRYPMVTFDRKIGDQIPYVYSDNYQGGKLATQRLIEKGCKKIAHISGNLHLDMLANQRHQAYVDTVRNAGYEPMVMEAELHANDNRRYEELVYRLFEKYPDMDGLFASSDLLAFYAMKVAASLGKKIPDQLKVVGYDNIFLSSVVVPSLTTIAQPVKEMAERAVDLLITQIEGKTPELEHRFPVQLIERETC
ncbi:LacI family DNA-binding transcriptional regulator [Thermicanus aegyptius]|uniref:LacI family DNA-binding transcriptional regulator n=1 Tax=Thermicanus aegyptius TaxID=94009 RepID=UPI000416C48D|nr:LacI family DNA-binding transcriptional regulator [Thermicanus aegyptius]